MARYTVRELLDKAYSDFLGDTKHQLWDDTTLLSFLNDGYVDMAQISKFTQKQTIYDFLVGNSTPYTLPQDLIEINFFIESGKDVKTPIDRVSPLNSNEQDKILLVGMDSFLFNAKEDTQAILTYWNEPDDLLITDTPELPKTYQMALVHYISYRAYKKDQSTTNLEASAMHYKEYMDKVHQLSDIAFKSLQQEPLHTDFQGF